MQPIGRLGNLIIVLIYYGSLSGQESVFLLTHDAVNRYFIFKFAVYELSVLICSLINRIHLV